MGAAGLAAAFFKGGEAGGAQILIETARCRVGDNVDGALHRIGGNGRAARQRFDKDKAECVGPRGKDETIGLRIAIRKFLCVHRTEEVDAWISSGCGVIESQLNGHGYSTPVASGTGAFDVLRDLNALFAAARVEMSRVNVTLGPGERVRGQVFDKMFWDQLAMFMSQDLTLLGLTRSTQGKLYVGGTSITEKQKQEKDSDRVEPRFHRGIGRFPGTIRPDSSTASSNS